MFEASLHAQNNYFNGSLISLQILDYICPFLGYMDVFTKALKWFVILFHLKASSQLSPSCLYWKIRSNHSKHGTNRLILKQGNISIWHQQLIYLFQNSKLYHLHKSGREIKKWTSKLVLKSCKPNLLQCTFHWILLQSLLF